METTTVAKIANTTNKISAMITLSVAILLTNMLSVGGWGFGGWGLGLEQREGGNHDDDTDTVGRYDERGSR